MANKKIIFYTNRTCKDCEKYPCFPGIDKCKSDFAYEGCRLWSRK